jgi:hypothetical protein
VAQQALDDGDDRAGEDAVLADAVTSCTALSFTREITNEVRSEILAQQALDDGDDRAGAVLFFTG